MAFLLREKETYTFTILLEKNISFPRYLFLDILRVLPKMGRPYRT